MSWTRAPEESGANILGESPAVPGKAERSGRAPCVRPWAPGAGTGPLGEVVSGLCARSSSTTRSPCKYLPPLRRAWGPVGVRLPRTLGEKGARRDSLYWGAALWGWEAGMRRGCQRTRRTGSWSCAPGDGDGVPKSPAHGALGLASRSLCPAGSGASLRLPVKQGRPRPSYRDAREGGLESRTRRSRGSPGSGSSPCLELHPHPSSAVGEECGGDLCPHHLRTSLTPRISCLGP